MKNETRFCHGCNWSLRKGERADRDDKGHIYHNRCFRTYLHTKAIIEHKLRGVEHCEKCNAPIRFENGARPEGVIMLQRLPYSESGYLCVTCSQGIGPI